MGWLIIKVIFSFNFSSDFIVCFHLLRTCVTDVASVAAMTESISANITLAVDCYWVAHDGSGEN